MSITNNPAPKANCIEISRQTTEQRRCIQRTLLIFKNLDIASGMEVTLHGL